MLSLTNTSIAIGDALVYRASPSKQFFSSLRVAEAGGCTFTAGKRKSRLPHDEAAAFTTIVRRSVLFEHASADEQFLQLDDDEHNRTQDQTQQ